MIQVEEEATEDPGIPICGPLATLFVPRRVPFLHPGVFGLAHVGQRTLFFFFSVFLLFSVFFFFFFFFFCFFLIV
jgi:hypothetical protein